MPQSIDHYENFPVASWLCPPHLRPPIAAIYHFARTADDIADEGHASANERLADLAAYRADLHAVVKKRAPSNRWRPVFEPLASQMAAFDLPPQPLDDLLSAFTQDVTMTRDGSAYADMTDLLDYCSRSASPVGRLLLHLYGVRGEERYAESDAICSALQLINFWQDLSVDIPRGRYYLPLADCAAHGFIISDPARQFPEMQQSGESTLLIKACVEDARARMLSGAQLVHRIPGRAGWELRAVVQGGLRILDKIAATGYGTLRGRPTVGKADAPIIFWRMLRM
ncbi:squalene synthase HpnC [Ottowia thiooxydans]|uniref:squalene synthase HpnC n=1 Tax=Ottowia thiooxydans TaxID=219182 RepID=UPI000418D78D|nr:squalene synthase HpnC [Ottowia thiooxydans]